MRCASCQADNPAGNRFCEQCGAELPARCAACGAPLRLESRFCGGCGAGVAAEARSPAPAGTPASYTPKHLADKILTSRSALEGERRQVTVLFADMAGFSRLAETLDPEEVHRIVNSCFELITAEIHRFEGTINQYTGDGVMALFGAPIAHEDSARRAVHSALGIQRALSEYSHRLQAERGLTVAMRIGLNTGPVMVGRIGDDLRMDYTAVGDTTNLAARMQQTARPGTVIVTEATHKVVEGFFETRDLGPLAVKGHEPVRAFEVQRPRGTRSRIEIGRERGLTPFVGRTRELALLVDRFREASAERGRWCSWRATRASASRGSSTSCAGRSRRLSCPPRGSKASASPSAIGFDTYHQADPDKALGLFEETLVRAEKAFGAHRWRWSMHLRLGLAMALGALGRDGDALAQAARGLRQAEETGSTKYVGWFHLVQGELALGAGQPAAALTELGRGAIRSRMLPTRAQEVARRIGFPTLTWQSAHRLAEAQAAGGCLTDAASAAILAAETIERMAAEAPDARCRETLLAWPRVQAAYETLERLRRLA